MQLKQQIESCVRITVQIPKDAAQRLRQMATEGNPALHALGIMSVQLDGDSVITIKLPGQEINLKTIDNVVEGSSNGTGQALGDFTQLLNTGGSAIGCLSDQLTSGTFSQMQSRIPSQNTNLANKQVLQSSHLQKHQLVQERRNMLLGGPSTSSAAQALLQKQQHQNPNQQRQLVQGQSLFKPPNTVCPMDGKVPVPPIPSSLNSGSNKRDYPFVSMRQARVLQGRENAMNSGLVNSNRAFSTSVSQSLQMLQNGQIELTSALPSPANLPLKVIKNSPNMDLLPSTSALAGNNSQFLQPPPPPYPGMGTATANVVNKPVSQTNKTVQNYLQKGGPPVAAFPTTNSTTLINNNIAISSPLLVNLLQNDVNSSTNQVKLSPQASLKQQLSLPLQSTNQQQPNQNQQQQLLSSPMRTQSTPNDTMLDHKHAQQQQQAQLLHSENTLMGTSAIGMPLSPGVNTSMRNLHQQQPQQIITSPGSNIFGHHQMQSNFQPQHVGSQQNHFLRQQSQQQLQAAVVSIPGTPSQRFMHQQQSFQQSQIIHNNQASQQNGVGGIILANLHQQQSSNVRQVRPIGVMTGHVAVQQQPQQAHQFLSSGGMSPAASHSPASSHHSMHSPLIGTHQQQILSPSTTPDKSPHSHTPQQQSHQLLLQQQHNQLQQQQTAIILPPAASPSSSNVNINHNSQVPLASTLSGARSTTGSGASLINTIPPPPDYNQTPNLTTRWPVINKPMDSETKSSFQEFARYQMQYNLQQQQINNTHQSQPMKEDLQKQQSSNHFSSAVGNTIGRMVGVSSMDNVATPNVLSDPLISLSDFEALTTNDLDALLPTLNCDLDSTLSLDDKNELESLLQDAKDLDLDLIEENLSAVGVDIDETAAAASSLLDAESAHLPPNVTLGLNPVQFEQNGQISQNIQNESSFMGDDTIVATQQNQLQLQLNIESRDLVMPNRYKPEDNVFMLNNQSNQKLQLPQVISHSIQPMQHSNQHLQEESALHRSKVGGRAEDLSTQKQFLINPLTGEMEPMQSDDSETEAEQETQQMNSMSKKPRTVSTLINSFSCNQPIESLPNSLFLEDDSNSCGTSVSKISANEQNNGIIPGAGSDTERSRDSLVSNKSHPKRDGTHVVNKSVNSLINITEFGTIKSPNANFTSGTTSSATSVLQKKSKSTTIREKQQNYLREKKQCANTTSGSTKPRRTKANVKSKSTACMNTIPSTTLSESTSVLATPRTSEMCNNNEKIKLRLKLEKKEPVSPAYKVDISFVASPKLPVSETPAMSPLNMPTQSNNSFLHNKNLNQNTTVLSISSQQIQNPLENSSAVQHQSIAFTNFTAPQIAASASPNCSTDEPRVPPLHISLRGGKNSIVIKSSRKDRKKPQSLPNASSVVLSGDSEEVGFKHITNRQSQMQTLQISDVCTEIMTQEKTQQLYISPNPTSSVFTCSGSGNNSVTLITSTRLPTLPISSGDLSSSATSMTMSSVTTPSFLGNKNGLTISAIKSLDAKSGSSLNDNKNKIIGSTNIGTLSFPPQLMHQSQYQKHTSHQLSQTSKVPSSLPGSITLSNTLSNNNIIACSGENSVNISNRGVINTMNLKTAATITAIGIGGGKPLTKNQKPPSYITAVQQLQLQKHQQKQLLKQTQFGALSESQSAQETLVAVTTMLPSATTLKRVTIPKSSAEQDDLVVKSESVTSTAESIVNTEVKISTSNLPTALASAVVGFNNQSHENVQRESMPAIPNPATNGTVSVNNVGSSNQGNVVSTSSPALINVMLRNSPGSNGSGTPGHGNGNGMGEDSGIESMDALSEKSPHQQSSSSPTQQQINSASGSTSNEKSVATSSDVKKSLKNDIKKEKLDLTNNINEKNKTELNLKPQRKDNLMDYADDEIEKALARMEGFKEDYLEIDPNASTIASTVKRSPSVSIANTKSAISPSKIEPTINEALSEHIGEISTDNTVIINKLSEKIIESITAKEKNTSQYTDENIVIDNKYKEGSVEKLICSRNFDIKTIEKLVTDGGGRMNFENKKQGDESNMEYPISIEIPTQSETECNRIRTRASSRLESPLDVNKSSPTSNESNANYSVITSNKQVITTRAPSIGSVTPQLNVTCAGTEAQLGVGNKRKRQESDTSANNPQLNECTEEKRLRSGSISSATSNVPIGDNDRNVNDLSSGNDVQDASKINCSRNCEESSDSDEPLIEVAEKVRNSKAGNVGSFNTTETTLQATRVNLAASGKSEFCNTSSLEKSRNSRIIIHPNKTSFAVNTIGGVPSESSPTSQIKSATSTLTIGAIKNSNGTTSTSASGDSNSNSNNVSVFISANVHCTRGNANSSSAFTGGGGINNNNNISEEKIGTRRSVRTNAGVHKNVYGRLNSSGVPTTTLSAQNTDQTKASILSKTVGVHGSENMSVVEVRRKTRSAVIGEAQLTEGRRRRNSRDYK